MDKSRRFVSQCAYSYRVKNERRIYEWWWWWWWWLSERERFIEISIPHSCQEDVVSLKPSLFPLLPPLQLKRRDHKGRTCLNFPSSKGNADGVKLYCIYGVERGYLFYFTLHILYKYIYFWKILSSLTLFVFLTIRFPNLLLFSFPRQREG